MAMDGMKDVTEGARDAVHHVQDRMAEGIDDLRGYADTADAAIREFARERPLLAIACAVGVGFLIGRMASRF